MLEVLGNLGELLGEGLDDAVELGGGERQVGLLALLGIATCVDPPKKRVAQRPPSREVVYQTLPHASIDSPRV